MYKLRIFKCVICIRINLFYISNSEVFLSGTEYDHPTTTIEWKFGKVAVKPLKVPIKVMTTVNT